VTKPLATVTISQCFTACFATVFSVALIVLCFSDNAPTAGIIVLGVVVVFLLFVTVVDPSLFDKFSMGLAKGELSFSKATPENVDETLKAVADQEAIERKDGGQSAETLRPLIASVVHKVSSARTDADFLALATDAWRANNTDDAMRFVYAGLERPASDTRITAALYSRLATIEDDLGLKVQAEQHYRRAIAIDSRFVVAHNNLGNHLRIMKHFDEAETSLREAIRLDLNFPPAHYNLGILLTDMKRFDEAEASYREAIRIDPDFFLAHNNLGIILEQLGKTKEAEEMFARAKELEQTQK